MSAASLAPTVSLLRSLYKHVETLEEFAERIVFKEGKKAVLVGETDTGRFKSFIRDVFVCYDKELQQEPSCNQICTLPELLAFVLNNLKRKRKRNVLAHGYNLHSVAQNKRDADPFKFQGDVTQSAAYIHGSDMWKKITMRLGTDITRYLLESCSVFVAVPPSCVFQVCGVPVYDKVSTSAASPGFHLQPQSRTHKGARFGRCRHALTLKRRQEVGNSAVSRKRSRTHLRVNQGKRKRETEQEDEEIMTHSGKKRRVGHQNLTEIQQFSSESVVERGDELKSTQFVESSASTSKQPEMKSKLPPLVGGPSWRTGVFPPLPPMHCYIHTVGFMYGGRGMGSFLLNKKKKCSDGSRRLNGHDLVRTVFFEGLPYLKLVEGKLKKLPLRFFNMVPLFSKLLRQHKRCPYHTILHKICPLAKGGDAGQGELRSLLPQHCSPHRVYLFVKRCLLAVIPQEMWGSDNNRLNFFARVRYFLHSGRFERLSLAELMWKMKVNDCDWLKISKTGRIPPSELSYRTQILGQFLAWLVDGFVVSLVHACFYATESVGQKNAIRFYRREVWVTLQDLGFRGHITKGQMVELTPAEVALLPKTTVISRLRFIPKTDSMRPITRVVGTNAKTRFYQGHVRDLMDVLRACVSSTPSLLGCTVWGMKDIHKMLSSIAPAQKEKPQPLYFVKVDVSGAYESLPHKKLLEVIGQALSPVEDELFTIRHYAKVWVDSHEGLKKLFLRQAGLLEDNMGSTSMKGFVTSLQKSGKVHHAILVEQHFSSDLHGRDALQFFTQMLTGSIIKYGKKTYRQSQGVPQGSAVSSLLCCLCYGHMENTLFKTTAQKTGCLMRLVDDFLLITPSLREAETFLKYDTPSYSARKSFYVAQGFSAYAR